MAIAHIPAAHRGHAQTRVPADPRDPWLAMGTPASPPPQKKAGEKSGLRPACD